MDECKTAQLAAYFLLKAGGKMPLLKLMKLLYLADRESISQYDYPITFDHFVAMPHGPVLSLTLDIANGFTLSEKNGGWKDLIEDRDNHDIAVRSSEILFDRLSDADIEVIEETWTKFGSMNQWQIRDFTHDQLPEWIDPQGTSRPIPYKSVLTALGYEDAEATDVAEEIMAYRDVAQPLAM